MLLLAQDGFFDGIQEGLNDAWEAIVEFTPKLVGALLILLVGWLIARFLRGVFERLFKAVGLDKLLERAGMGETLTDAGYTVSGLLALLVYWIAILITLLLAAETLDLGELSALLRDLIAYLPLIFVAAILILVAGAVASVVADLIRPWADREGVPWLTPVVRFAIIAFGLIAAFNTLNLADELVNTLFIAVVATIGVTMAVAFGVGGIKSAEEWWKRVFPGMMRSRAERQQTMDTSTPPSSGGTDDS